MIANSQTPDWLFAENMDRTRTFIVYCRPPRFIGEILDTDEGDSEIVHLEWLDEPPLDAALLAKLMRQAGEALVQYDELLGM